MTQKRCGFSDFLKTTGFESATDANQGFTKGLTTFQ